MRLKLRLSVFATALIAGHMCVMADEPLQKLEPIPQTQADNSTLAGLRQNQNVSQLHTEKMIPPPYSFNGFAQHRAVPDLGAPGSAGHGFQHFMLPMDKYTNWYRPRAATLTQWQRCAPDDFRPRGLGHLFARPCDGFRMEYTPFQLQDGLSQYGPAYIARQPDPQCEDCNHEPTLFHHK